MPPEPDPLDREIERLREALLVVRYHCLMTIRRAAFAPTIGVRYSEQIRADIANECAKLEQLVDGVLVHTAPEKVKSPSAVETA